MKPFTDLVPKVLTCQMNGLIETIGASNYVNSATRKDLGFELRPYQETVIDTANDFIEERLI